MSMYPDAITELELSTTMKRCVDAFILCDSISHCQPFILILLYNNEVDNHLGYRYQDNCQHCDWSYIETRFNPRLLGVLYIVIGLVSTLYSVIGITFMTIMS